MVRLILIILLLGALCGAAYFTRPTEADFHAYVKSHIADKPRGFWDKVLDKKTDSEKFLEGCVFKDNWLWVTVEKDGKPVLIGAFDYWIERGNGIPKPQRNVSKPTMVTQID